MKRFLAGFLSSFLLLAACAATPIFPFKFYNLSGNNFSGTLLGEKESDDVPFDRCRPVNNKQQCVVTFYTELNSMVKDYKDCKQQLTDCQRNCN